MSELFSGFESTTFWLGEGLLVSHVHVYVNELRTPTLLGRQKR